MRAGISKSKKRATISFTLPGDSKTVVQEGEGREDAHLRSAIKTARAAFWRAYRKPRKTKV